LWAVYAANSFAGRVAAIRAAGDPASISDLAPKAIPPDQDAAAHLASVSVQLEEFGRAHGRFFDTPQGKAYEEGRNQGEPATSEQIAAIEAILQKFTELDDAIANAAKCDAYASPLDYSLVHTQLVSALAQRVGELRTVERYLRWQIQTALAHGRHAEALDHSLSLLRIGRLSRGEPGIISGMVSVVMCNSAAQLVYQALAAAPTTIEFHTALDRELALHDPPEPLEWTLKSERAMVISALQEQARGLPGLLMNTFGRLTKMQPSSALDLFDIVLEDAAEPWHKVSGQYPASVIFTNPGGLGIWADMMQPPIYTAYETTNRAVAISRCLRIYNAMRRYELEHGREPEGLMKLGLPAKATLDPFSGEQLKLKQGEKGRIVYSVGRNGKDDVGDLRPFKDYGVGPAEKENE
jgi:hypothetical protein